jgi:hypothetical protein
VTVAAEAKPQGYVGSLEQEVEDVGALVERVGGNASLYGSSSGSVIVLWTARAGVGATSAMGSAAQPGRTR